MNKLADVNTIKRDFIKLLNEQYNAMYQLKESEDGSEFMIMFNHSCEGFKEYNNGIVFLMIHVRSVNEDSYFIDFEAFLGDINELDRLTYEKINDFNNQSVWGLILTVVDAKKKWVDGVTRKDGSLYLKKNDLYQSSQKAVENFTSFITIIGETSKYVFLDILRIKESDDTDWRQGIFGPGSLSEVEKKLLKFAKENNNEISLDKVAEAISDFDLSETDQFDVLDFFKKNNVKILSEDDDGNGSDSSDTDYDDIDFDDDDFIKDLLA